MRILAVEDLPRPRAASRRQGRQELPLPLQEIQSVLDQKDQGPKAEVDHRLEETQQEDPEGRRRQKEEEESLQERKSHRGSHPRRHQEDEDSQARGEKGFGPVSYPRDQGEKERAHREEESREESHHQGSCRPETRQSRRQGRKETSSQGKEMI